jgi:hypothetical protein
MKAIKYSGLLVLVALFFTYLNPMPLYAGEMSLLSKGQTVYVPAYSHIYYGNRERPFLLTITISIRNIDPNYGIKVMVVDYYETRGKLNKSYLDEPIVLNPLESVRYIVPEKDKAGGSGANFIVKWKSENRVNPPIIETIMIGAQSTQGISFTSRGQAIANSPE